MGKISKNKKKNQIIITNKIKYPEVIQQRLFQCIKAGIYPGFLPVEIKKYKENKKSILQCKVDNLLSLKQFMENTISKEQFLDIANQIIDFLHMCEEQLLSTNNIELNMNYIFLTPTNSVRVIYWPVVNNQSFNKPRDFFKQLSEELKLPSGMSTDFLRNYSYYLNGLRPFSLTTFERIISELSGTSTKKISLSPESKILGPEEANEIANVNPVDSADKYYNPFVGGANNNIIQSQTEAFILRNATNEKVVITKNNFTIGSDSNNCTYTINDNSAISRVHAIIQLKDNQYCISDNNSTNKSFINNIALTPGKSYILEYGMEFQLADETFTFIIE